MLLVKVNAQKTAVVASCRTDAPWVDQAGVQHKLEGPGVRTAIRRRTPACTMTVLWTNTAKFGFVVTLMAMALLPVLPSYAANEDIFLQCEGEVRSRLLAFSDDQLETQQNGPADRRLHIQIRNTKRAVVMDHPSGEVLFGASQCKLSSLKVACEVDDGETSRQMFISRTSGNAMFEGYSQTSDEKSTLVVESYACIKEDREPLF